MPYSSPLLVLALTLLVVFIAHLLIAKLLHAVPPKSSADVALLDAVLLCAFISPFLLFLVYRPMKQQAEIRRVNAQLRESERRISTLMNNLPGMAYRCRNDDNWTMTFISDGGLSLTGYPPSALIGNATLSYVELIHPDDWERVLSSVQTALAANQPFEFEYRITHANGETKWVWERGCGVTLPSGGEIILEGFISDVTERKQAEKALRKSEERYRGILESMEEGYYEVDTAGNLTFFNESMARILGYPPEKLVGMSNRAYTTPDVAKKMYHVFSRVYRTGEPELVNEYEIIREDGTKRLIELSVALQRDERLKPIGFYGVIRDVSEFRRGREERRRLALAIEQTAETILITDAGGTIEYVNPAFEKITGYSRDESLGRNVRLLQSGKHDRSFYDGMWGTLTCGEVWSGHFINKKKDGTLFEEEASITPIRDPSGKIINYVAVKRDVTHEVLLREQLRQSQKMEAIGQLAGGVSHDFNNLLQAILGYSGLAMEELSPESQLHRDLEEIRKAAERAANLTRQLLAFSRRQLLQSQDLNLNGLIADLMKMLRRVITEYIQLDLIPGHQLGSVYADPGQIEQVILNLVINARDAMPSGGKITIETENVLLNGAYCESHPWARQGRFVLLSVTDTGCGISPSDQEHIFEPFFTTKKEGEGTGLGLATVYGIVKQHEGYIHVYSEQGKGTTFKIYLPIVERHARAIDTKLKTPVTGGTETILLAEDDKIIRGLASRILEEAGYTVLVAEDGEEAAKIFQIEQERIELAILDAVMPKLSGRAVYELIKASKPDIPVLFSTGYGSNVFESGFFSSEEAHLMQKPYDPDELLRKVRAILDRDHRAL